jgi:hypothetical protein
MTRLTTSCYWLFALGACVFTGCGTGGGGTSQQGAVATSGPKRYAREDLPDLEDHLPPQDDGRVEVAAPEGWNVMGKKTEYVARFAEKTGAAPPRILIKADDAPAGGPNNVTQENVAEFQAFIEPIIQKGLLEGENLREPVRMVILGDKPWARYIRGGKFKGMAVDRQILKTIAGGRIYTIELQVYRGNLMDHRDAAYAVAAGMNFLEADATGGGGEGELDDVLGGEDKGDDEGGGETGSGEDNGTDEEGGEGGDASG